MTNILKQSLEHFRFWLDPFPSTGLGWVHKIGLFVAHHCSEVCCPMSEVVFATCGDTMIKRHKELSNATKLPQNPEHWISNWLFHLGHITTLHPQLFGRAKRCVTTQFYLSYTLICPRHCYYSFLQINQAMVLGIWGSLVWRDWRSSRPPVFDGPRILDEAVVVLLLRLFSFDCEEVLEELEFGVRRVPAGLSIEVLSELDAGGRGSLLRSQACRRAALGVILVTGSHSKHLLIKSKKRGSSHPLRAVWSSLLPGGPRGFPRLDRPPFRTVDPSGNVVAVQ